ncbi:MAG: hypothetical protein L3J29_05820, partial [Cyclobacteriaceae bacterium]|nr:hypothetical protein [Cyclobacteriaceae bacterium]
ENIRRFREVSLKPKGKISSRQSFEYKNLEIIHYIFAFYIKKLTYYFIFWQLFLIPNSGY